MVKLGCSVGLKVLVLLSLVYCRGIPKQLLSEEECLHTYWQYVHTIILSWRHTPHREEEYQHTGAHTGWTAYPPYAGETVVVGSTAPANLLSDSSGHTLSDWSLLACVTCHRRESISLSFKTYIYEFFNASRSIFIMVSDDIQAS